MCEDLPDLRKGYLGEGLKELIEILPQDINMVEIGCYLGDSTQIFLDSGKIKRISCIDPYVNGYDNSDTSSFEHPMDKVFDIFKSRIEKYGDIVEILRTTSQEGSLLFENESLDFVYIDGCHLEAYVRQDLDLWFPKVKIGGILGGHDFEDKVEKTVSNKFKIIDLKFQDSSWAKYKK